MRVQFATEPAHVGIPNEDFIGATPGAAVLLDGAGNSGAEAGCTHDVAWYVRQLGAVLVSELTTNPKPLPAILSEAIRTVRTRHDPACDLDHPGTPSATVVLVRSDGDTVDYLVLADSVLLLETGDGVEVVCDDREAQVGQQYRAAMDAHANGTEQHRAALRRYIEQMRRHRNRPGGFWVAATDPDAALHALTGSRPAARVRAAALLSDGASRLADRFGLADWRQVLDTLSHHGPADLIAQVRRAEESDLDGTRWPRGKTFDDATAAYCAMP